MKGTTYDRITNSTVIGAIASALLFDRVPWAKWEFGAIGIVCAATAAVAYFLQHWDNTGAKDAETRVGLPTAQTEDQPQYALDAKAGTLNSYLDLWTKVVGSVEHQGEIHWPSLTYTKSRSSASWANLNTRLVADHVFVTRREQRSAEDEVEKIIDKLMLARKGDDLEIVISRDGSFTVRCSSPKTRELGIIETPGPTAREEEEEVIRAERSN